MGVCYVVANIPEAFEQDKAGIFPSQTLVYPWEEISAYFTQFEHRNINIEYGSAGYIDTSSATIIQPPAHGMLVATGLGEYPAYYYKPNEGYFGKDFAIIEGEVNGLKAKLQYYFHVLDTKMYLESEVCGKKGWIWKISFSTSDATSIASLFTQSGFNLNLPNTTVTIADLPAGALGQTTGTTITLDTNAAGHNWFIDYTPYLNEEYLPTANPNVWQAKEGGDAAGKMDMLSVLLHEYGHVLGIEHSADQHASMASTLTPGTRRLPTADELALMARLVGEVKTGLTNTPETPPTSPLPLGTALGGFWLARMRKSGPGEAVQGSTSAAGADDGMDVGGRATQGAVAGSAGAATSTELDVVGGVV